MGSKKHKKESKKKKHRSRSRSPLTNEEKERKKHKKHKERRKERSPDIEEVPVDSHLIVDQNDKNEAEHRSRSRSSSAARDRRHREERKRDKEYLEKNEERKQSPVPASSTNQDSLSIEETNRLRAKLGLKPLEVSEKPADDGKIKDDLGEFYHKPATNITKQKQSEKIREKLQERKDKRKIEQKLQTTLLGEASDDDDASAWVKKSRVTQKQKEEAAKRAALLDEMDEVFGVSALVAEERRGDARDAYTAHHLAGLRVGHRLQELNDERDIVLTLADKEVLAEDGEDVLVNVNIVDNEKYKKNLIERKKAKSGYQAYEDDDEVGLGLAPKSVLAKYDDELGPPSASGVRLGHGGTLSDIGKQELRASLRNTVDKRLESLQLPQLRIASDYLNEAEMAAKFKKTKKKGKIRKKPKHEPIDVEDYDPSTAPLDTDDTEVKPELLKEELVVDEEEVEPDSELQTALARARRMRQGAAKEAHKVEDIMSAVKEEAAAEGAVDGDMMVLDATAEFCRTLGDIPTYGLAGNRDHDKEIIDFEHEEMEVSESQQPTDSAWSRVDVQSERPPDIAAGSSVALDAEPALGGGVFGALQLALSKGYLERASAAPPSRQPALAALHAKHYSIDDKAADDDKHARRERGGYAGPLTDFREKSHFKPNIKLEYVDDDGRPLCPKEAFRYLSHKFHGKGPGKNKQEKRLKKSVQEGLMKKMSSTDTPLGTLALLQEKQKETHSPFIVLSGLKKEQK